MYVQVACVREPCLRYHWQVNCAPLHFRFAAWARSASVCFFDSLVKIGKELDAALGQFVYWIEYFWTSFQKFDSSKPRMLPLSRVKRESTENITGVPNRCTFFVKRTNKWSSGMLKHNLTIDVFSPSTIPSISYYSFQKSARI